MNGVLDKIDAQFADFDAKQAQKATPPPAPPKQAEPPPAQKQDDPPPAPNLDIDALLGGEPPKQDAPPPNDKEANLGFLRKSSEAAKEEARRAKAEADEARKEAEKLRAELSKLDIAYDPVFTEKYEKPMQELAKKAKLVGHHAGLKSEQVEQIIRQGLDLPRPQLKEMLKGMDADADTVSTFMTLALEKTLLNEQRAEALRNHEATSAEVRQARLAQQAQKVAQLSAVRGEATKAGVRALLAEDTTGFFKPKTPEEAAEVGGTIKLLPTVLDPQVGEDAVQHHARQVKVMAKGLAFDALAKRNADLQGKYDALVAGVKARGWGNVEADTAKPKLSNAVKTRAEILAENPDDDIRDLLKKQMAGRR